MDFSFFVAFAKPAVWIALLLLWTAKQGRSTQIQCRDPGVPENGYRHGEAFLEGHSVTFGCNEGFDLYGDWRLACVRDRREVQSREIALRWNGTLPRCLARTLQQSGKAAYYTRFTYY